MISDAALKEFKAIWQEEFKQDISDEAAMEEATQLLTLFDAIYRPIKKEWVKQYDNETNLQSQRENINLGR